MTLPSATMIPSASLLSTGSLVRFASQQQWLSPVMQARLLPDGRATFKPVDGAHGKPVDGARGNLRITGRGLVDHKGGQGPWAQFLLESAAADGDQSQFRLKSVGHAQKGRDLFLTADVEADRPSFGCGDAGPHSLFSILPAEVASSTMECDAPPAITLTDEQRAAFKRDGVLVLPGVVGEELVQDALRAINARLGAGRAAWREGEDGGEMLAFPHLQGIGNPLQNLLLRSPLNGIAEQLLLPPTGRSRVPNTSQLRNKGSQVALRFPLPPAAAETRAPKGEEQWHIDGINRQEHANGFQLLVGVALSAQPDDDCGNLHVWPGKHGEVQDAVDRMRKKRARADPMHAQDPGWLGEKPKLDNDDARQVYLQPGDVVLAHQKTPHRIGLNRSPNVRYQIYFRLSAQDHDPEARLASPWDGWHGLSE